MLTLLTQRTYSCMSQTHVQLLPFRSLTNVVIIYFKVKWELINSWVLWNCVAILTGWSFREVRLLVYLTSTDRTQPFHRHIKGSHTEWTVKTIQNVLCCIMWLVILDKMYLTVKCYISIQCFKPDINIFSPYIFFIKLSPILHNLNR